MNNLILFTNTFLSYIVLMIVIAVVAALGFWVGSIWRKSNEAKTAAMLQETDTDTE